MIWKNVYFYYYVIVEGNNKILFIDKLLSFLTQSHDTTC